jgi:ABC-type lipoprotein release transport system permease subunit
MKAFAFAWRSLVRQPARATLGILGVAAVGALLLDMLLLSEGLVASMRDLLERSGYDVRVGSVDRPGGGPLMPEALDVAARIAVLPPVQSVLTVRMADARVERGERSVHAGLQGIGGDGPRPWTILRGSDLERTSMTVVVNEYGATTLGAEPGDAITVRANCEDDTAAPPPLTLRVTGVASFPFDDPARGLLATTHEALVRACGETGSRGANIILVTSAGDADAAARAINGLRAGVVAMTNDEAVTRMERAGFSYFRQISTVLTTVTVAFALLLITVLLTVSVNQRLGEIAALRALGFSRRRVVSDVLCESALIVGIGGVLSIPLGGALAVWLDTILKRMPGIPADLHFFVFDPGALMVHAALLALTAVLAAAYPMRVVARLPIAATLRAEIVS